MVRPLFVLLLLAPAAAAQEPADPVAEAVALFRQARADPEKYPLAARRFAEAYAGRAELTPDQLAAWAYCRIHAAADRWNAAVGDPALTSETATEIEEALRLAPNHPKLQTVGRELLSRMTGRPPPAVPPKPAPPTAPTADANWLAIEGESVIVRCPAAVREVGEELRTRAEEQRAVVFARWSGPPAGGWIPKCELVLHPTATAFAAATGQPAEATGHALVKLAGGRATVRRIDLRADDPTLLDDALPRELTHVVLADLFPDRPPPAWAAWGMAVRATSPAEQDRYARTLPRVHADGTLLGVPALLTRTAPPADDPTGFAVASAGLVDYLVRLKGERSFTLFLRDAQRYGAENAVKRQYGYATAAELDAAWRRAALSTARGQKP